MNPPDLERKWNDGWLKGLNNCAKLMREGYYEDHMKRKGYRKRPAKTYKEFISRFKETYFFNIVNEETFKRIYWDKQ